VPMANFMAGYVDDKTGLPKPSYDLWEQQYVTSTYTTAVVYGALQAAAELAEDAEDPDNAVKWRSSADDISAAAHKHLYNPDRKMFYKSISIKRGGKVNSDPTIDLSSLFGAFMFGLFPANGEEMTAAFATVQQTFGLDKGVIGVPRFENDDYYRANSNTTGNWWVLTTLWTAQIYLEKDDMQAAHRILTWTMDHMGSTGVLPEQLSPIDGSWIGVAPLTWSHAEYISTLLDTITEKKV